MGIILKFILKNIFEKKLRTFLIVLAIVLSSGVFFASMAISDSLMKMFTGVITGFVGNADLMITQTEKSPTPYITTAGAERYKEKFEYIIGQMSGSATYTSANSEEISVSLKGISLEDLQKMNPYTLEQESGLYPFEGRKVILSKTMCEKRGIKLGDLLDFKIGKVTYKFTLCGIASPNGPFSEDAQTMSAVVPKDTLSSIYDAKGRSNTVYVKLKNPLEKQQAIQLLSGEYKKYRVSEPFPFDMLKSQTSMISAMFLMLSCIVFFMSIFIIYSSFKVITTERLPVIGTLRSVGATRRTTNLILLGESIIYGVIGGFLGCGIGVGILYLMTWALSKMVSGDEGVTFNVALQFSAFHFVSAFFMAVILCFVSSIIPIVKVSRIPVKDIVLNFIQRAKKSGKLRLILGIVFIITAFLLSLSKSNELRPIFGGVGMLLALTSLVLLVPYLTIGFVFIFERLYIFIFGNIGILAAKNLRENKSIINNISMLAIGISSLLMFNTASYDSAISIVDMYKNALYDIEMYVSRADRNMERLIRNIDGVQGVYGDYETYQTEVVGKTDKIQRLKGIDINRFLEYWKLNIKGDPKPLFEQLEQGRNIMLAKELGGTFNVKAGDVLTLKTKSGEKNYKVIGFFENLMNSSNCALISERYYKLDMQAKNYSSFFIKAGTAPEGVVESIKKEFKRWRPYVESKSHIQQQQLEENKKSIMLMQGFSVLAMIIAIFGVINNLLISFIERKHSLAVFRSMGMSKSQSMRMIFIESLTGGLIGGGLGIFGGVLMITILAGVNTSTEIHYPVTSFFAYLAAGAGIMLIASISPALKSSKLDIVSTIKME